MSTSISRKITLTLLESNEPDSPSREYEVSFPTTGQMLDIELMKIQLSDGKFDTLKFSYNPLFQEQATNIEIIATFAYLIPNLKKDLVVKSFLELPVEKFALLKQMYLEQFLPWYEEWITLLNKPKEDNSTPTQA